MSAVEEAQEQTEGNIQTAHQPEEEDHFSRFMFGGRRQSSGESIQQPVEPLIDYEELVVNIDTLVESARNLKPLFKRVYPAVSQFFFKK